MLRKQFSTNPGFGSVIACALSRGALKDIEGRAARVGYGRQQLFCLIHSAPVPGQHLPARRYSSSSPTVPDRKSDGLLTVEEP